MVQAFRRREAGFRAKEEDERDPLSGDGVQIGQNLRVYECESEFVLDLVHVVGLRHADDGTVIRIRTIGIGIMPGREVWFQLMVPSKWKVLHLDFDDHLVPTEWAPYYELCEDKSAA